MQRDPRRGRWSHEWREVISGIYHSLSMAMHNPDTPEHIFNWFLRSSDSEIEAVLDFIVMQLETFHAGRPPPRQ